MNRYLILGLRFLLGFMVGVSAFKLIAVVGLPLALLAALIGSFCTSLLVTKMFEDHE